MNTLVINLTRFGDLLQTQPVLHGLKAEGHRVGLLCLENFAPAAALLDSVDYVCPLPGGALLSQVDRDWRLALWHIETLLESLERDFPVQGLINTTATLGARLLTRRLAPDGALVRGFGLDEDGFGISGDFWTAFLQGAAAQRINCPFNIVDMFRMAAGLGHRPACGRLRVPGLEIMAEVDQCLTEAAPSDCAGYVAFQLGASEARRQWPVERFAGLGVELWKELRLCPVLLGAPSERPLAQAYAAASRAPFIDCVGKTDVPHLAGVLLRSRLLVTNDTGTMHLAAGQGVPVLALFLATAQPWDTGPYLEDCCCLEPALDCHPCPFHTPCPHGSRCLEHIPTDIPLTLIRSRLERGRWEIPAQDTARVWVTGKDSYDFADLSCISGHERAERTVWLRLQRHFYRHILDSLNMGGESLPRSSGPPSTVGLSSEFRENARTALRQTGELLHLLGEQGVLLRRMPGPAAGQRMLGTCTRVHGVLEQCVPLAALGHLWLVLSQERGGNLDAMLQMASVLRKELMAWQAALETD